MTYPGSTSLWVGVSIGGLLCLLMAEKAGLRRGKALFKIIASTGFVMTGVCAGGLASRYGLLVLLALVFSWFGDVFLLSKHRAAFLAGLVSFLLAHLSYTLAFASGPCLVIASGVAALCCSVAAMVVVPWLWPHLDAKMRGPVVAYIAVISVMVVCSAGAAWAEGRWIILVGATMFYLSDITVARDRFVAPGFVNGLWGLPLYYGGQLLLALSVCSR